MNRHTTALTGMAATLLLVLIPAAVAAHDTPNMEHTHAFKQTGYGTYRQGHSVNGKYGSITIWSPRNYPAYKAGDAIKFARPAPMTRAPATPTIRLAPGQGPQKEYGKARKD
jgi:hypothetical protein